MKLQEIPEVIAVTRIAKIIVDQETGQRGFLLTGQDDFLEPYREGKRQFNLQMRELRTIVSNNRELADKINQLAQDWKEKAAIPKPNTEES